MALKPLSKIVAIPPQTSGKISPKLSATSLTNLIPIEPRELAVRLAYTLAIWPERAAALTDQYREALADVPADLVEIALRHVRQRCKWPPTPAELREPIERLLTERQRRAADLERRARDLEEQLRERADWLEAARG